MLRACKKFIVMIASEVCSALQFALHTSYMAPHQKRGNGNLRGYVCSNKEIVIVKKKARRREAEMFVLLLNEDISNKW